MNILKKTLIPVGILLAVAIAAPVAVGSAAYAAPTPAAGDSPASQILGGTTAVGGGSAGMTLEQGIKNVVNILLFLLGAIAVIMIIIGGIRYATSNGDANGIKGAKDTILYAIIGLVVAILAYAIVNFVVGAFATAPA